MNNYSKMNPLLAGALAQANFEAAIQQLQGNYNVVSTFASDFAIADSFGAKSVEDTYNRSFENFKDDVYMMTEMTLVLNWAIWRYYELKDNELATMYDKLWRKCDEWMMTHFKGEELEFYLNTVD